MTSLAWRKTFFSISTDYQMDKAIPTWGRSKQLGPTYFFSKITQYLHIICVDSCGVASGPSRMQRNIVYTRDESSGGSKNSDDTVSTVFDFLLSRSEPASLQPKIATETFSRD
jgi:hypothetical protein